MAEYIELDRVRNELKKFFNGNDEAKAECESLLCTIPTADVAPVPQ